MGIYNYQEVPGGEESTQWYDPDEEFPDNQFPIEHSRIHTSYRPNAYVEWYEDGKAPSKDMNNNDKVCKKEDVTSPNAFNQNQGVVLSSNSSNEEWRDLRNGHRTAQEMINVDYHSQFHQLQQEWQEPAQIVPDGAAAAAVLEERENLLWRFKMSPEQYLTQHNQWHQMYGNHIQNRSYVPETLSQMLTRPPPPLMQSPLPVASIPPVGVVVPFGYNPHPHQTGFSSFANNPVNNPIIAPTSNNPMNMPFDQFAQNNNGYDNQNGFVPMPDAFLDNRQQLVQRSHVSDYYDQEMHQRQALQQQMQHRHGVEVMMRMRHAYHFNQSPSSQNEMALTLQPRSPNPVNVVTVAEANSEEETLHSQVVKSLNPKDFRIHCLPLEWHDIRKLPFSHVSTEDSQAFVNGYFMRIEQVKNYVCRDVQTRKCH